MLGAVSGTGRNTTTYGAPTHLRLEGARPQLTGRASGPGTAAALRHAARVWVHLHQPTRLVVPHHHTPHVAAQVQQEARALHQRAVVLKAPGGEKCSVGASEVSVTRAGRTSEHLCCWLLVSCCATCPT